MNIKIFYDGARVAEFCNHAHVVGVTTNISFLKKAGIRDYKSFALSTIPLMNGRPISFQVFDPTPEGIERQAREITSWGENVYVKIPVVYPDGSTTVPLIKRLSDDGLKINVTCVYTKEQIDEIAAACLKNTSIVSIFCGRINDTGAAAVDIMTHANESFSECPHIETLWAGCQRARDILDADACGTDIITVPEEPLKKTARFGQDIHNFSVRTSVDFFNDGAEMFIGEE